MHAIDPAMRRELNSLSSADSTLGRTTPIGAAISKDTIIVACAGDRDYLLPLTVTLKSLLVNLSHERSLVVYILTNAPTLFRNHRALAALERERVRLIHVMVSDEQFQALPVSPGHISTAAYYRLLIPRLLPEELDKVIYLDSDLIVNADIGALWDLGVEKTHVLAVPEQAKDALYVSSPSRWIWGSARTGSTAWPHRSLETRGVWLQHFPSRGLAAVSARS